MGGSLKLPVYLASRGPNNAVYIADADNRIVCEIRRGKDDIIIALRIIACLNHPEAENVVVPDPSRSSAKI